MKDRPLFTWTAGEMVEWSAVLVRNKQSLVITMTGKVRRVREDGWIVVEVLTPSDQAGRLVSSSATDLRPTMGQS